MTTSFTEVSLNPTDEKITIGPLGIRFLVAGKDSSRSLSMFELTVPGSERLMAPAHSHAAYEETIYGLSGVLTFMVDGKRFDVGPGQALCIPRGAVHRFDNHGAAEARALCVITPAEQGPEYFREVAAVMQAAAGGPPDRARMLEIMARHGLRATLPA